MIALFNCSFYLSQLMKFWIIDTDSIIITNIYTQSGLQRMSSRSKTLNTLQFCFKMQTLKGVSFFLFLPPCHAQHILTAVDQRCSQFDKFGFQHCPSLCKLREVSTLLSPTQHKESGSLPRQGASDTCLYCPVINS